MTMPTYCEYCDEPVTDRYAEVMGNNDGRVFGCPDEDCQGKTGPKHTPERDHPTSRGKVQ